MSKTIFFALASLFLLTACGSDDPVNQDSYAYRDPNGVGGFCAPRVAKQWNLWIASQCNSVNSDRQADACVAGAERFRLRNPNITCKISVADTTWGPGNWQAQSYFEINNSVIYGIFYNFGRNSPGRRGGGWSEPPHGRPHGRPHGPHNPHDDPRGPAFPGAPGAPNDDDGHFPIPDGAGEEPVGPRF